MFLYFGGPDGPASSPAWSYESNQDSAGLGRSVDGAGDLDGDGYSDLVVSADGWDGGFTDEGQVYVFFGGDAGPASSPDWSYLGGEQDAALGSSVAAAGDLNGDGFADLAVGSPLLGASDDGALHVFYGSGGGLSAAPDLTVPGAQSAVGWAGAVSAAGDVNGDGYGDLLVGADAWTGTVSDEGGAFLLYGGSAGLAPSAAWGAVGGQFGSGFGTSVAGLGDVNGDGYADFAAGSPDWDGTAAGEGRVQVWYGSAALPATAADWTTPGALDDAAMGAAVAGAGDVNGDGYADLLVGATGWNGGEGQARLYLGAEGGLGASSAWEFTSGQAGAELGSALDGSDLDGDGFGDAVIGAAGWTGFAGPDAGKVWLFSGAGALPDTTEAWFWESPIGIDEFWGAGVVGDLDGDGYSELVLLSRRWTVTVSHETAALMFFGTPEGPDSAPSWVYATGQNDANLRSVAGGRDVDGDGHPELLLGEEQWDGGQTNEGRVRLFYGGPGGPDTTPDWTVESNAAVGLLGSGAALGDWNGDGYADVAAGATNLGTAWVWNGSPTGLTSTTADWTYPSPGASLGVALANLGDVNGDDIEDLAVASMDSVDSVLVFYGDPGGLPSAPSWSWSSGQGAGSSGHPIAGGGDLDADGYPDLVVGSPTWENGEAGEGKAFLFSGGPGGLSSAPVWTYESNMVGAQLGASIAAAGDVDGDGWEDLAVGSSHWTNGEGSEGAVLLWLGGPGGLAAEPDLVLESNSTGEEMGVRIATGDIDGDGFSDVVGVATGASAWFYRGGSGDLTGAPPWLPATRARQPGSSLPLVPGTLSTGSGLDVTMFARTPWGRTRAGVEVEGKPNGTPFDGEDTIVGPWTDLGTAGVEITQPALAFFGDTWHHWRARLRYDPSQAPPQVASRWLATREAGHGQGLHFLTGPDGDGDGWADAEDCQPFDPLSFPGAPELCDGLDNDCDGSVGGDEVDDDGDGYDECADGDSDDTSAAVFPTAPEGCDGIDTDCDGAVPDVETDGDDDGETGCEGDCDDLDPTVFGGAAESCDAIDSDCDGSLVDEFDDLDDDSEPDCIDADDDGDGFDDGDDCGPLDPTVFPGADEGECDGIDQNCDGDIVEAFTDTDGDGMPDCADNDDDDDGAIDAVDCFPLNPEAHPGAEEACDGLDTDCNGVTPLDEVDEDGDSSLACEDCDDDEDTVYPDAEEECDGLDNDCDDPEEVDEGLPFDDWYGDADGDGFGSDVAHPDNPLCESPGVGWIDNDLDCDDEDASTHPGANEIPDDGIDNDCDGSDEVTVDDDDVAEDDGPLPAPGCMCTGGGDREGAGVGLVLGMLALVRRSRRRLRQYSPPRW